MQELKSSFISNFIDDNRWRYITDGLKITLLVTVFAVLIGVVLIYQAVGTLGEWIYNGNFYSAILHTISSRRERKGCCLRSLMESVKCI